MLITVLVRKSLEQDFNILMCVSAKWGNISQFLSDPNSFYKHVCCRFSFSKASNILLVSYLTCHVLIRQLKSSPRKLSIGVEVNIQSARSGLASWYYVILINKNTTHKHLIRQYTRLKNLEYLSTDRIEQTIHTMNRLHPLRI